MSAHPHPVIDGNTRLVGIIGFPVAHSLSPALHNAAFAHLGLNMAYVPLPVESSRLAAALSGLAALGFVGANVTVPHKTAAAGLVDDLLGDAAVLEAVNTIVVRDERLEGHNTDVEGFVNAYREVAGAGGTDASAEGEPSGRNVSVAQGESPGRAGSRHGAQGGRGGAADLALLLGAGGAARAAALGVLRLGFRRLLVVNRTPANAEALCALVRRLEPAVECSSLALADLDATHVEPAQLIVNATTMGMEAAAPAAAADAEAHAPSALSAGVEGWRPAAPGGGRFRGGWSAADESKVLAALVDNVGVGRTVYDMVYGPGPTEFVRRARERGAQAIEGQAMLVWQAAAAFRLWTGLAAPIEVMRRAVER